MRDEVRSRQSRSLEEEFFLKQEAELIQKLRDKAKGEQRREALSEASGITDDEVLDALIAMDIRGETLAALALVPLVVVAWADGKVQDQERKAILQAAAETGLTIKSEPYALLEGWLDQQPGPALLDVWKDYAASLAAQLSDSARRALTRDILGRAERVAEAAGGFLGLGNKVSREERDVLNELKQAFATDG